MLGAHHHKAGCCIVRSVTGDPNPAYWRAIRINYDDPPAAGITPLAATAPIEAIKAGRSAAISAILRDETPNDNAPHAFPFAICGRKVEAPS
jgi:hypothetical protein